MLSSFLLLIILAAPLEPIEIKIPITGLYFLVSYHERLLPETAVADI